MHCYVVRCVTNHDVIWSVAGVDNAVAVLVSSSSVHVSLFAYSARLGELSLSCLEYFLVELLYYYVWQSDQSFASSFAVAFSYSR